MNYHFFSRLFVTPAPTRIRYILKGYQVLKDSESMSRIADIKRELTTLPLKIPEEHFSNHIFGGGIDQAEIVCQQYLLTRIAGVKLNRALLYVLGKPDASLAYYLPPVWRKFIGKQGFKIASFHSAIMWNGFLGLMLAYGVLKIFQITFSGIQAACKQSTENLGRYVYFNNLSQGNLPQPCQDGRSHDIISWYMQWSGRDHDIDTISHSVADDKQRSVDGVPVVSIPSSLLPLKHFKSLVIFIVWSIVAILIAALDILRGRWWHALLLNQAALAAQVRIQDPKKLASDYLFHNSGWIYRPLWTYEAEKQSSRIIFYFYSTNCESFKLSEKYPALHYGWHAMNWPHYLVWNDYQADFVRRAVGKTPNISIVGPIWFNDTNIVEMPKINKNAIAVFDITPVQYSSFVTLAPEIEYYVPETCIPFLDDIRQVTNNLGFIMVWKCKRKRKDTAPEYHSFVEHLSAINNVITVDPDISANRVIEESDLVISMPFTSTALIARELGKPSYYYDPTGLIQKDDRAAHGIEIISGIKELTCLLRNKATASGLSDGNGC